MPLLPSLDELTGSALAAWRRFPLVLLSAAIALVVTLLVIDTAGRPPMPLLQLGVASSLGLPLLFAATMLVEAHGWTGGARAAVYAGALATLLGIALAWPSWTRAGQDERYALYLIAFHLAAAVLPYIGRSDAFGFWQYNRTLLLRFVTAAFYGAALFVGLAVAIGAIGMLFDVRIGGVVYGRLYACLTIGFGTVFFLGGLPSPITAIEARRDYPDGLRKFTQFVLVPLVIVYLLILTAYLGKVLITQVWPSGWIGWLVSVVSCVGLLAWLLVWPLEVAQEDSSGLVAQPARDWVRAFARGFLLALVPSLIMLWLALGKRIAQYGLTELRVLAVAGALWLSAVVLVYGLLRRGGPGTPRDRVVPITFIPLTLGALILLLSVGPLSAFALSRRDQVQRLEALLQRHDLLRNGRLVRTSAKLPAGDAQRINDLVWYLRHAHGPKVFDAWLADSTRAAIAKASGADDPATRQAQLVVEALGVPWQRHAANMPPRRRFGDSTAVDFFTEELEVGPVDTRGFESLTLVHAFRLRERVKQGKGDTPLAHGFTASVSPDSTALVVRLDGREVILLRLDSLAAQVARRTRTAPDSVALDTALMRPEEPERVAAAPLVLNVEERQARARLVVTRLIARKQEQRWVVRDFTGQLLVGRIAP